MATLSDLKPRERTLWPELEESLPSSTFKFFTDRIGHQRPNIVKRLERSAWANLCESLELEMERKIQ